MDTTRFLFFNIVVAKLLKTGVQYIAQDDVEEIIEKATKAEEPNTLAPSPPPGPEPSWFLPYILALQLSVLCLFVQTLRKYALPSGRARNLLICFILSDLVFTWMDVLQFTLYSNYGIDLFGPVSDGYCGTFSYLMDVFQHLSVGLHLFLCGEVSGMLSFSLHSTPGYSLLVSVLANAFMSPMAFEIPQNALNSDSCTAYRNMYVDWNYATRLSSLHLLPCICLAFIFIQQRAAKVTQSVSQTKSPNEKGDEVLSVLNMKKFTLRSMVCHYIISAIYTFLTIGIKARNPALVEMINQFDSPDNILRKLGYLHQAANTICLLACLNLEESSNDVTFAEEFDDVVEFRPPVAVSTEGLENQID